MTRYVFHCTDGVRDRDRDGTELPDLHAARREAVLYAAATLEDNPEEVWSGEDLRIEVADESGMILFTVIVLAIDSAAVTMSAREPRS